MGIYCTPIGGEVKWSSRIPRMHVSGYAGVQRYVPPHHHRGVGRRFKDFRFLLASFEGLRSRYSSTSHLKDACISAR